MDLIFLYTMSVIATNFNYSIFTSNSELKILHSSFIYRILTRYWNRIHETRFVSFFLFRSNIICGGFNDCLSTKVSGQIASKTTKADRKNSQSYRIINLRNKWKSADICYTRLEKMAAIVDSCHVILDGIN